jgi:hypothetical protein
MTDEVHEGVPRLSSLYELHGSSLAMDSGLCEQTSESVLDVAYTKYPKH